MECNDDDSWASPRPGYHASPLATELELTVRAWIDSQAGGNPQSLEQFIRDNASINEVRSSLHLVALFDEDLAGLLAF